MDAERLCSRRDNVPEIADLGDVEVRGDARHVEEIAPKAASLTEIYIDLRRQPS